MARLQKVQILEDRNRLHSLSHLLGSFKQLNFARWLVSLLFQCIQQTNNGSLDEQLLPAADRGALEFFMRTDRLTSAPACVKYQVRNNRNDLYLFCICPLVLMRFCSNWTDAVIFFFSQNWNCSNKHLRTDDGKIYSYLRRVPMDGDEFWRPRALFFASFRTTLTPPMAHF